MNNHHQKPLANTGGVDWLLISLYFIFIVFGWISIYAAVYKPETSDVFNLHANHGKQIVFIVMALVIGVVILFSDYELYPTFSYLLYGIILLLMIVVIFAGSEIQGARSWFDLGFFKLQPSEFGKYGLSLALAKYLSGYDIKFKNRKTQLVSGAMIMIPMVVTLLQNDTGSALVYLSFILVLYREGLPGYLLFIGLICLIVSVLALLYDYLILMAAMSLLATLLVFLFRKQVQIIYIIVTTTGMSLAAIWGVDFVYTHILQEHQRTRIDVLLGKNPDIKEAGYNVHQSKIAIGSGGLTGKGFLEGTQTKGDFVPEQSTDFIFCTVGEEHGFIGAGLLVILYVVFLWRMVLIAERQRNKFNRVFAYSAVSIFFFHFFINIGMTIGLLPVIGIPLPFFSYGGSSMIGFSLIFFTLIKLDSNRVNELQSVFD